MHQRQTHGAGGLGDDTRAALVDAERFGGVVLRAFDIGVGARIDHQIRFVAHQALMDRGRIRNRDGW